MTPHEAAVKAKLEAQGYSVYKRGIPDFLAVNGRRVFFVEAKSGRTRLTVEQLEVKEALRSVGLLVLCRPSR